MMVSALAVAGCASVYNLPSNQPLTAAQPANVVGATEPVSEGDLLLALSFSGGGTRAAAFSFGVLNELDRIHFGTATLLDRIDFVSGVSGGSVTAAYYGLKRRGALADFRERFLLRNAEEGLRTEISLGNLGRALRGGVNDSQFPRWLDQNVFEGATFSAFRDNRPTIWINASDIYNRVPFIFDKTAFDALCSDIGAYKIADAVAASAAVPVAFAPIVLETFPGGCGARLPDWIERARSNPSTQPLLRSYASALGRYQDGGMKFVKLLDGGLVDNFGLSGLSIGILGAQRPFEPLGERQAARVRRLMFLVVDAGRGASGDWANRLEGPAGVDLVEAAADTAIDASVRSSYAAFSALVNDWTNKVRRWRCGLSAADRARLGLPAGWKCNDVVAFVDRIGFDRLGAPRSGLLEAIPTRLALPAEQVDMLIEGGADALRKSTAFQSFRQGL
ncbi:patatin-like phospholipase family protein [Bradyrhizobium sp. 2TAF24]|uniref:patatin-like phospholipase family protein n=1 Tax=Bradyrhizobium sp. 2TAF24 TaxID=3233011 RepID=UPI003F92BBFD